MAQVVVSKARRAAPIAASMSGSDPSAATPITSSVAGLTFSNVLPPVASTSLPSINRRSARHTSVSM